MTPLRWLFGGPVWRTTGVVLVLSGLAVAVSGPLLDGAEARYVHIRWGAQVDASQQEALEQRYGLRRRSGGDRSYGYDLVNASSSNVRALLADPAVEDTQDIDRAQGRASDSAAVGEARTGWAWRWNAESRIADILLAGRVVVVAGLVLLLVAPGGVVHAVRRRPGGSGFPGGRRLQLLAGAVSSAVGVALLAAVPVLDGDAAPSIQVQWRDGTDQDTRRRVEEQRSLREQFNQGYAFTYDLLDESPANIKALIETAEIEATGSVDRTTYTVTSDAVAGARRNGLAWRWGFERRLPAMRNTAGILLLAGAGLLAGWPRLVRVARGVAAGIGARPLGTSSAWLQRHGEVIARARVLAAFAGVFLFALLLRWVTLGTLGGDDHWSLWTAATFLNGDRPFQEFVEPGDPLYWGMSALAQAVVGYRAIGEIGLGLLLIAVAITLSFRMSWQASRSWLIALALAVATAMLVAPTKLYSYPKIFLYPLGIWLSWRYIDRPGLMRGVLLAAGVAVAFGYRHDHGAYLAAGASAAVVAAHWSSGPRVAVLALCRVGLATIVLLSPYFLLVQANEGLVPYFRERMRFAAQTDAAGRRAVPFAVDPGAPLLFSIAAPASPTVGVQWTEGLAPEARTVAEQQLGLAPVPPPAAGGWHRYVITDYSTANLTALLAENYLTTLEGVSGSFRQGFAVDEDAEGESRVMVRYSESASAEQIAAIERRYQLERTAVDAAAAGAVRYVARDRSVANITALRRDGLVTDVQGIHFVRVPVDIRLRNPVPVGPTIAVQWADDVTAVERADLETRHGLANAQPAGTSTWKYELADRSDANVTALATSARAAMVDQIDRGATLDSFRSRAWVAPPGGNISIVWSGALTAEARTLLEQRYHLQREDDIPGTMSAYVLRDASPDALRALLAAPQVADISGIDRATLRPVGDSWFTSLARRFEILRFRPLPRLLLVQNAGVWMYYLSFALPLVVLATLGLDRLRGRAAALMPREGQKMFAVAALMAVANFALLRKLGYFPDHFDAAAIMAAWLLGRALHMPRRTLAGVAAAVIAVLVTGVSVVSAAAYVDLPTFAQRYQLNAPPERQWAMNAQKFRGFAMSPPIDLYAPPDAEADRAVVRYLYECTRPEDRIFVTSDVYTVPYYTQRRVVGHIFWANGFMATPEFEERMIALMERDPVPFIFGVGGEHPLDNLALYPRVRDYVARRYPERHAILQDQLAGRVLWLMTDSRRTPTGTYAKLGLPCYA